MNNDHIKGGTFSGSVENNSVIASGTFSGDTVNFDTITGGTFAGKLTNNQGSISGITIELSNALIEGGESYGWSLDDNNLSLNSGITFYWKAGEECAYHAHNSGTISGGTFSGWGTNFGTISGGTFSLTVYNHGTISGGTFSGNVDNGGTISGGKFSGNLGGSGIVTGTTDLSELATLDIRHGPRFGKDVKLPKAVIKGNLTYTGCDSSTVITLEYYADGVNLEDWTVSGRNYSFRVEGWKRTDPEADLSGIEEISHDVKAVPMEGYEITIENPVWDRFDVTVAKKEHKHIWSDEWSYTHWFHWHDCTAEGCDLPNGTGEGKDGFDRHLIENPKSDGSGIHHKGTCSVCGYAESVDYCEYNLKHDNTNHWYECICGDKKDEAAHSGGKATCTEKAVCEACKEPYGDTLGHDFGEWLSNGDGTHTRTCANDTSHKETDNCSGGKATCTEKAVCEACKEPYGDTLGYDFGEWLSNGDGTHTRTCANDASHKETDNCSGGKVTCTEKAVCETCKSEHGETDPNNHGEHKTVLKGLKKENCTKDGYTGDTHCEGCDKMLERGKIVLAKGHHYGEWKVVYKPTENEYGRKVKICSECGNKVYGNILPLSKDGVEIIDYGKNEGETNPNTGAPVLDMNLIGIVAFAAALIYKKRR